MECRYYSNNKGRGIEEEPKFGNDFLHVDASATPNKKRKLALYSEDDFNVKGKSIRNNDAKRDTPEPTHGTERDGGPKANNDPQEATRLNAVDHHQLNARGCSMPDKCQVKEKAADLLATGPSHTQLNKRRKLDLGSEDDINLNEKSKGKSMGYDKKESLKLTIKVAGHKCLQGDNQSPKVTRGPDALEVPNLDSKENTSKVKSRWKHIDFKEETRGEAEMTIRRDGSVKRESSIQNVKRRPNAVSRAFFIF